MLIVGLTGGIGSGKSTVAELFAKRGVPVLDADAIGRELVTPGQPCLEQIVAAFGPQILHTDGTLDRNRLREIAFADASKRHQLEAILHPAIRQTMAARLSQLRAPYALLVIPLLLETGQHAMVQRILVVDTTAAQQRARVKARSGLSDAQIDAILAAQLPRAERLAAADDVIVNDQELGALAPRVEQLHRFYLQCAADAAAQTR